MNKVYLDHAATTPIRVEVYEKMVEYMAKDFANADSIHSLGRESANIVLACRDNIAKLIGADSKEIYFTSGGTESDNWAIKGVAFANKDKGKHIITTKIEHPAVYNSCAFLEENGFDVTYLDVNDKGFVSSEDLIKAIREDTILISIMFANNEIGTIQDIKALAAIAKEKGILFHTDAVQATGTIKYDVKDLGVDLLSISGHKFYGPKGIGILYVKEGTKIAPFVNGGEQERGRRGGTTPTSLIVGIDEALTIASKEMDNNNANIYYLKQRLIDGLKKEDIVVNGSMDKDKSLPGTVSITFNKTKPGIVLNNLDMNGICASAGSACTAASEKPSRTLLSIGLSEEDSKRSVRFSIGRDNTKEEIDYTISTLKDILKRVRED